MMITKNAIIEGLNLGPEDHGILTLYLRLDYGDGRHQGFGGYPIEKNAGFWLTRLFETFEIREWSELKGKNIRVILTNDSLDGQILGIGHIIKDKWFMPKEELKDK